jgi:hypothetical protein
VTTVAPGTLSALGQAPTDANTGRPETEDAITVLRQDVQTDKTEIITRNMNFTEEQAKAFWLVYRDYAHEQQAIADQRIALIKDYAGTMTGSTTRRQSPLFHERRIWRWIVWSCGRDT